MVYGIDDTIASRIASWKSHGYHTALMTGVAWGRYAPYLRGDFDGKQHWDDTQQKKDGTLFLHSGREVPYISPSEAYGKYLAAGVRNALDAGAEAVYLEEPEFWADAGWSDSFKRSWQEFYHEPWEAPDSSPEAQFRASQLKYVLYRRALQQVFTAVREYGEQHGRTIPCYVATHSLLNYAQWKIVSPEISLLSAGADGFIAQVWTGTARTPNVYRGITQQRTFETAFLEYGALQNIARSSGKPIWYLNDPIEDNPNHSWTDYRENWQSTLTASLLQPAVSRYEVLPWPHRIFEENALYPATEPTEAHPKPEKVRIPADYVTELQTVFQALGQLSEYSDSKWEKAGTEGLGVLVSDTLMFERAQPQPSDPNLSQFYGLALPLLMRGMPVEPVSIEAAAEEGKQKDWLSRYRILLLSYEGQKPLTPAFDDVLAKWVRAGGALVVVDADKDPYNHVQQWWNTGTNHFATPREHLFKVLGVSAQDTALHRVGKGVVLFSPQSPTELAASKDGADAVMKLLQTAAAARGVRLTESNALELRRGPYVIAAGLDTPEGSGLPSILHGDLIDLFDAGLSERREISVASGARVFALDLDRIPAGPPRILAASGRISAEQATASSLQFRIDGIDDTQAVVRILATQAPKQVLLNGAPLSPQQYSQSGRTVLLHFTNHATSQEVHLIW